MGTSDVASLMQASSPPKEPSGLKKPFTVNLAGYLEDHGTS